MEFFDVHTHNLNAENGIFNLQSPDLSFLSAAELKADFSVGLHPCSISKIAFEAYKIMFEQYIHLPNALAIGECGFDKYALTDFESQKDVFLWHYQMSESHCKPLIIHCVGHFNELIQLKQYCKPSQKWIIHGFRAKLPMAQQLLRHGFYLSFGAKFNPASVAACPYERMFCETDDCSELDIEAVYCAVANAKGVAVDELLSFVNKKSFC